jgi:hypothetical protein
MIIENVIAGLTRNLLIVFGNWGIAGQARNDEARQLEMHPCLMTFVLVNRKTYLCPSNSNSNE